ncbi:NADPH-dependent FMN reductase [Sagittula stellata]|nr:NADPH-dependent FMN reductase [Sagittula stellata]
MPEGPHSATAFVEAEASALYCGRMDFLAISGSARRLSTNTAMLRAVADIGRPDHVISVFDRVGDLPVFSPDLETDPLPDAVQIFVDQIQGCDGLIISSPEYVRAIPGGLKNAIDWLVSRDEIIHKPIALMHSSHRGDDVLAQLRIVLATVSTRFSSDLFLRFELMKKSPAEIAEHLDLPEGRREVENFLRRFAEFCAT